MTRNAGQPGRAVPDGGQRNTGRPDDLDVTVFERHRRRLFGIAYGMLGSVADAEDVVQDAYLRWMGTDTSRIDAPAAYLTTVTTRIAVDRLRSAHNRRERYVGPWLPEPLIGSYDRDPADAVAEADQLSLALLMALERLTPTERAVLVLREVFDLDYAEIADVVDKSPANCRQIAARARSHVGDPSRGNPPDPAVESRLLAEYTNAITTGDVDALAATFAADVVLWADGGGRVRAARHPLHGAERVARHLVGVSGQTPPNTSVRVVRANGEPGLLGLVEGRPIGLVTFDIGDDLIVGVHALLNPDKLANAVGEPASE